MEQLKNNIVENNGADNTATETKTYTEEEVQELLQRETDRRVTSALKKAEEKNIAKIKEAEKLAAMNEADKFQYQLEQREKAIEEKEKALALAENKATATTILAEKGLSPILVDFIVAEDADTMDSNIKILERAFKESVKMEVEKRLGSNAPKKGLPLEQTLTKDMFRKMSLSEQSKLYNENPEIYKQMVI